MDSFLESFLGPLPIVHLSRKIPSPVGRTGRMKVYQWPTGDSYLTPWWPLATLHLIQQLGVSAGEQASWEAFYTLPSNPPDGFFFPLRIWNVWSSICWNDAGSKIIVSAATRFLLKVDLSILRAAKASFRESWPGSAWALSLTSVLHCSCL